MRVHDREKVLACIFGEESFSHMNSYLNNVSFSDSLPILTKVYVTKFYANLMCEEM